MEQLKEQDYGISVAKEMAERMSFSLAVEGQKTNPAAGCYFLGRQMRQ